MKSLLHAFPEFTGKEQKQNGAIKMGGSNFRCLAEELRWSEGQVLPEEREEVGKKIQEVERQAYLKGLKEGEAKGMEMGKRCVEPMIESLSEALRELDGLKKEIITQAEKVAVKLAIALAQKILRQEIKSDVSVILKMAEAVVSGLKDHDHITIRVNPQDAKALRELGYDLKNIFKEIHRLTVKEDPYVDLGGFIVDTQFGELDGRIDSQLEVIEELLMGEPQMASV